MLRPLAAALVLACVSLLGSTCHAEVHLYVADHMNKTVMKLDESGKLLWSFPNNNGHDVQLLKNGHLLIVSGKVQEIDMKANKVVWEVGAPTIKNAEAAQRLDNGNTMIVDDGAHAIIDVDAKGKEIWHYDVPNSNNRPHQTMRQSRRLENGNTLICVSTMDEVWEVTPKKEIVWKYKVPFPYLAVRLENGNTLISSGDGYGSPRGWYVIEVDKAGKEVWKYGGEGAPEDQQTKFPTGLLRMKDGSTYIAEAQGNLIRHVAKDKSLIKMIKSPAMQHPCTIALVDE